MRRYLQTLTSIIAFAIAAASWSAAAGAAPLVRLHGDAKPNSGLIQKVHSRHCRSLYGPIRHWHGGYGHVHRRVHRHGRCYSRLYYYRPYYRAYVGPRFYYGRRYGYRRFYRPRRRGVSIRFHF